MTDQLHRLGSAALALALLRCLLLLGAFTASGLVFAAPPAPQWQDLGAGSERIDLVDGFWALRESLDHHSDARTVLDRPDWLPATIRNRNASWTRSVVWLCGHITNRSARPVTRWIVVRPWRVAQVNLYLFAADRPEQRLSLESGRRQLAASTGREHVDSVFPVTLAPGESARLLIALSDLTVPTAEVSAWTPAAYTRWVTLELLVDGMVLAVALALLVLLLTSGDRGFIFLGCWLATSVAFESLYHGKLLVYLLPHLADPIVPTFTQLGAAHYLFFVASTVQLLGLRWRDGWTRALIGVVGLANLLALLLWFFASVVEIRRVVALLGLVTVLIWPIAVWRTPLADRRGQRALRMVMALCCATMGLYVVMAHGGPLPQLFQWLKGQLRLDYITILGVVGAYHLQRRSQQAAQRRRIEFLAYHDVLTGLPNRERGRELLQQALGGASDEATLGLAPVPLRPLAVACLGLERFRLVNDSYGHSRGDNLLVQVAARMQTHLAETDPGGAGTVCRLSAGEFMLLLPGVDNPEQALQCGRELLALLAQPFDLDGRQIQIGASVGLVLAPPQGPDAEALLRYAGIAFHEARRQRQPSVCLYEPVMGERSQEQLRLREALRQAVARDELELHYQPQRDLRSGRVTVVEALLRWRREPAELTPPAVFIPLAEESGLIVPIGAWVLQRACREALRWPDLVVAVNVSAVQFQSGQLEDQVRQALADSGLSPQRLELELTESVLIERAHELLPTLARLRALGVQLSIDDFGTGYSSLAYLHRLNVDRLKIDRAFIAPLDASGEVPGATDRALVGAIVTMARQLGLRTVAEGVESEALGPLLAAMGCDAVQGYAIAHPMPAHRLTQWLEALADVPALPARLV